jgi:hypothetical protein
VRISTEIGSRSDADVIHEAEGSIRQQPLCEGVLKSAVSLAHGMFPKRLAGNPRELPISFTPGGTPSKGLKEKCNRGSTEGSMEGWLSSLTTP